VTDRLGPRPVPDELVTRSELAEAMRVSVRSVDRLRAEGMPCVSWGMRRTLFWLREAMLWAEAQGERKAA
jgi:phage terminase Nu1 subunit (DNA packaging protein)